MKKIKSLTLSLIFLSTLVSCQNVKDGLTGTKKNNKDEFLVQKKNPLVQPPNFNELPTPKSKKANSNKLKDNSDEVKKLLEDYNVETPETAGDQDVKSIEDSILEKINEN